LQKTYEKPTKSF